ncbi:MAG: exonuclease domain-containing protein [Kiritimatiellaeota bacterium]|nr:exonuclease domain-containing protein [Kiritimatiellota bacterium]
MNTPHGSHLVWFDTEYTSLELEQAQLAQVAMIVTDALGRRVATPEQDLVTPVRLPADAPVSDFLARECPALIARCRAAEAPTVAAVDQQLAARLEELLGPVPDQVQLRPVLAGNSIHCDWWLARRFLPRFLARLHYRQLDVSALKILWLSAGLGPEFNKADPALLQKYLPGWTIPAQASRHDAWYDVACSVAELNYYRKNFFKTAD